MDEPYMTRQWVGVTMDEPQMTVDNGYVLTWINLTWSWTMGRCHHG